MSITKRELLEVIKNIDDDTVLMIDNGQNIYEVCMIDTRPFMDCNGDLQEYIILG